MDDIEAQKRENYFDLGRDDFMALEEYLLSGLSNKDLGRAEGGIVSLYSNGGNVEKIKSKLATRRIDDRAFRQLLKESGFTKKATIADFHKGYASKPGQVIGSHSAFQNHLKGKGLNLWSNEPRMMQKVTAELNKVRQGLGLSKYVNVGPYSFKSVAENLASKTKGFLGVYAEKDSALTKTKYWEDALKLQKQGDKKFGTKKLKEKLRWIAQGLNTKWPSVGIGTTMSLLTKYGFGKTLPVVGHLITTEMGSGELTPEGIEEFKKYQAQARMNKRGGGLMDINDMTRPVGYDDGGDVTLEKIMRDMQDSEGPGEPGIIDRIIGNISPVDPVFTAKGKIKDVGKSLIDKINDFLKYGWGDKEDYMEIGGRQVDSDDPNFRRFIEDNYMGEGESYIDGIENYRRFVEGEGFRRGGIVSLNHMTRAL